jgi:hypothetical protein
MSPSSIVRTALVALMALLAAALVGCTTRDRNNPLDPKNRETRGLITGFNALAGDRVVELRWVRLSNEGVIGYRIQRWRPGGTPAALPGADFAEYVAAAEDPAVQNESTYVYRLIARLASGDSAFSAPDTATPGTRRIAAIVADLPGLVGLTSDARDILYEFQDKAPYEDLELDEQRGWFWVCLYDDGTVVRRRFNGSNVGVEVAVTGPADLTTTPQRGTGWAAIPSQARVVPIGPDTNLTVPGTPIVGVGTPRVVEGAKQSATLWIGSDQGFVYRYGISIDAITQTWDVGHRIGAIALDETADAAWVSTREGDLSDLYYVAFGSPDPVRVRQGLLNVTDLANDPDTRTVWVAERGAPLAGHGRLSRIAVTGETSVSLTGMEPYGLAIDAATGSCWVTDIATDRLLEVAPSGTIVRRSPRLGVPYGVRVYRP